jgi:tagatose 6-phosphate kinase
VILVVTLNPALDITHEVAGADWAGVNRPHAVYVRPGGKGVNVARTLAALGADVMLAGLIGGGVGRELVDRLAGSGIDIALTAVSGETRRTFTVVDSERGETAVFNEPGPTIGPDEYAEFFFRYKEAVADCSLVVLAGSLPRGVGDAAYADLIAAAGPTPTVLDSSGAALALGAAAGPAVVKPNLAELAAVTGCDTSGYCAIERAARQLSPGAVVVSLGPDGLLAVDGDQAWLARPGEPVAGNPTGAGDAVVAALADALVRGLDWPGRLRRAVALGAATVAAPVAGEFDPATFATHLDRATISPPRAPSSPPRAPISPRRATSSHGSGDDVVQAASSPQRCSAGEC